LILAAGYATRLYPLTKNKPKALLEVKGKLMVEHIVGKIEEIPEVDEVLVITNNKFSLEFEQWAEGFRSKKPIKIINDATLSDQDKLGAVGDMQFAIDEEKIDSDLLVIASDNLFEYSLKKMHDYIKQKNADVIACFEAPSFDYVAEKFGVIELDKSNKLIGFEEKPKEPKTKIAATACYYFRKETLKLIESYIKEGNNTDNTGDFIKYLIGKKPVYGFVFTEKWFDIGTFEALGKAREEFNGK
jgi:glucose-1-phosphate thymidylyltransferase